MVIGIDFIYSRIHLDYSPAKHLFIFHFLYCQNRPFFYVTGLNHVKLGLLIYHHVDGFSFETLISSHRGSQYCTVTVSTAQLTLTLSETIFFLEVRQKKEKKKEAFVVVPAFINPQRSC